jgi:oligoribonuclease NrnB/cAMP/cGMP phosphodiesterase (DHH superfamily)
MHVVYCSPQLDGIAAAAILFRYAKLNNKDAKLGGTLDFDTAPAQFNAMSAHDGDLLFILDFLPDSLAAIRRQLDAITVRNRIAYWNSHHPHSAEDEELLRRYAHTADLSGPLHYSAVPKTRTCAAELACARFLPNDSVAKELARMAHDIEFWKRTDAQAVRIANLIASGIEPKQLIDCLSRGVFWSERFDNAHQDYAQKKRVALHDLIAHLQVKSILNCRFGFTLAPVWLPSADAGQHVLDSHAGVDVSVVIYRNGRISFRRRDDCALNLAELAKLFGGGGHAYAAGARLAQFTAITRENFSGALFAIDQRLREHLLA